MTTATDIDLKQFWLDNDIALRDPFAKDNAQTAMGIGMGTYSMFAELGLEQDLRRLEREPAWANKLIEAYNDKAEQVVGKRLLRPLDESPPDHRPPGVKGIGEVFGCERVWQSESWWLLEAAHSPDELSALLDRVEAMDLEKEMFGDDFDERCQAVYEKTGVYPRFGMGMRGPVTLATSIYGVENLLFLIMDNPALAERFRDVLLKTIFKYFTLLNERNRPENRVPGFSFCDDNCALLTPEMYAFFAQPILQKMYGSFAPGPDDRRYQHSDSDMGHLLPLLAETGMNRVNFGPNVRFKEIREKMPGAIVEGTLAPFTFMRNETEQIIFEVQRDLDESRATRGLVVATAGSVNDGTLLTSLRTVMETIWRNRV